MDYNAFFKNLAGQDPNALPNDPFEGVDRMRTRYDQAGVTAPAPKTSMSLPEMAFKVLDYPGNVVRSAVFGTGTKDIGAALLGKTKHTRDYLSGFGMKDSLGKTALGFAGDVLLDPLMLVGSGLVKNAGKAGLESGVVKGLANKTAGNVAAQTAKKTGFSAEKVADALTQYGIKPEMNSLEAGKTLLNGADITGEGIAGAARRAQTQLAGPTSELQSAKRSMAGILGPVTSGVKGKGAAFRNDLSEGITSGSFASKNAWRTSDPRSYVEIQQRLETLVGKTLNKDQIELMIKAHMDDDPMIHTMLNLAEKYGTKIKDFDSLVGMSTKLGDADFVGKVAKANERLFGVQATRDAAHVRAVYANNLVVDIDRLGNKRYFGIMFPNGTSILPLIDVSPVGEAVSRVADKVYQNSSTYKGISDWFRTAITGDLPRSSYIAGGERLEQGLLGREMIKEFNRIKQILPQFGAEFVRNGLGREIMEADERILQGAVYAIERNRTRNVKLGSEAKDIPDPYTAYVFGNIADGVSPGELEFAKNYILENNGEEALKHLHDSIIDPFLAKGSKLTVEEVKLAEKYGEKAMFNTDAMLAHEKLQGLDAPPDGFKSWYVYHMYEYGSPNMGILDRAAVAPQSIRSAGAASTNTSLRAGKARDYDTIAEALAHDMKITKPVDNLVDLSAARFGATLRYGMNRGLIHGIDEFFESSLNAELKILAEKEGLAFSKTETVPIPLVGKGRKYKDVTTESSPELMEKSRDLLAGGQATMDIIARAMGGSEGLKALGEVIKKSDKIHPSDLATGEWVPIDTVFGLTQAGGSGGLYYARKELVPHIELLNRPIANTVAMRQFLELTDEATRYIKTLQTTMNPPFVLRNIAGEANMSFANGTKMDSLKDAGHILKVINEQTELNGKKVYVQEALARLKVMRDTDTVTISGKSMTVPEAIKSIRESNLIDLGPSGSKTLHEIYADAMRQGLINTGHNADVSTEASRVKQSVQPTTWTERAGKELKKDAAGPVRAYKSVMESATGGVDSYFRLADYIHNLRQGMTSKEAALRVKQFHVDYNDLTQFERGIMRRIVPYYTFMRKNTPMQLRLMVERPAYYGTLGKMLNASNAHFNDPSKPDYLNKTMALPIYEDENGHITYLNFNLPMADLSKLRSDPRESAKEYMQALHPGIKAPFDLAAGKNIMFGTPIKPMDYLASQLGGASTAYKAAADVLTPEEDFEGKYAKPEHKIPLFQSLVPTINPEKENLSRAYRYREELLADMQKRKKDGKPIPELPSKPNFGVNFGLTPYDVNANYAKNKDWIRRNKNTFTP